MNNDFTPKEIILLQKRAKKIACKKGYQQYAEDFSQEIFISFCRNWNSTFDQMWVDFIRKNQINLRTQKGKLQSNYTHVQYLDSVINQNIESYDPVEKLIEEENKYLIYSNLTTKEYTILNAINNGLTLAQIGIIYSVTESRICQLLRIIKEKIQIIQFGNNEYLNNSSMEIEWIKI